MIGEITYQYKPLNWSQEEFLRLGGFVVVFLNYNKAAFIRESVASALNQDYPLLEMFFMDDASTDGSGDEMEKIVREYHGRHKVAVVRNTENQHICGQWNIVSKLSTGHWFGMFCGDDVAFPSRVSLAAQLIQECPTIRGLSTGAVVDDLVKRKTGTLMFSRPIRSFETGEESPSEIFLRESPVVGATAFWHKSLFRNPLPRVPMDDVLLRWVLQMQNFGMSHPIWLLAGDVVTIRYSIGAGITSASLFPVDPSLSEARRWSCSIRAQRHNFDIASKTWRGIVRYYKQFCEISSLMWIAQLASYKFEMLGSPTLKRMFRVYYAVCLFFMNGRSLYLWKKVMFELFNRSVLELFGIRAAGVLMTWRSRWKSFWGRREVQI